jgi:hypothetical protein
VKNEESLDAHMKVVEDLVKLAILNIDEAADPLFLVKLCVETSNAALVEKALDETFAKISIQETFSSAIDKLPDLTRFLSPNTRSGSPVLSNFVGELAYGFVHSLNKYAGTREVDTFMKLLPHCGGLRYLQEM